MGYLYSRYSYGFDDNEIFGIVALTLTISFSILHLLTDTKILPERLRDNEKVFDFLVFSFSIVIPAIVFVVYGIFFYDYD
ncbi:hypothetical protein [Paenibacillus solani]|uniref:hypothetical protein n=1 Tax=Paenibacillus solani TaxID=1705565 RepID=UPI003D2A61C5